MSTVSCRLCNSDKHSFIESKFVPTMPLLVEIHQLNWNLPWLVENAGKILGNLKNVFITYFVSKLLLTDMRFIELTWTKAGLPYNANFQYHGKHFLFHFFFVIQVAFQSIANAYKYLSFNILSCNDRYSWFWRKILYLYCINMVKTENSFYHNDLVEQLFISYKAMTYFCENLTS